MFRKFRMPISSMLLLVLLVSLFPVRAFAVDFNIRVVINGRIVQPASDMRPFVNADGRTMLSVRHVTESLSARGCSVQWQQETLTVHVFCNDHHITFWYYQDSSQPDEPRLIGRRSAFIDGREHELLSTPEMVTERAFIGLRDLGNLLDARVEYIPAADGNPPQAVIDFDALPLIDEEEEYEESRQYLEDYYTFARVDDYGSVRYELDIPSDAVLPSYVPSHHVEAYKRALERGQTMADLYQMYAWAPPDDYNDIMPAGGGTVPKLSDAIVANTANASAKALAGKRANLAAGVRKEVAAKGGRVAANSSSLQPLKMYRDAQGTLIEILPGGERHYLRKAQKNDVLSRFNIGAYLAGTGSFAGFVITKVAKLWPYGTVAAAAFLAAAATYFYIVAERIRTYCAPSGTNEAIVLKHLYLKPPERLARAIDNWIETHTNFDSRVGFFHITVPIDCEPWSGIEPSL